jgi:HD-GYP domain-containing protein (c-di-GMP phosphodiesterase class II)
MSKASAQCVPAVEQLQGMLRKIDRLTLPLASRRDIESVLVCQVARELDGLMPWQRGHGRRTAALAIRIGKAFRLPTEELHHLKLAALLHDIGLLVYPLPLSRQHTFLDPDTYESIQNHPRVGSQLLESFSFLKRASIIIAHHHERWDGSGYPYGIRGRLIPIEARILSVSDAFDAVSVPNVRDRKTRDVIALRILRAASGTQFDPTLIHLLDMLFSNLSTSREDL